MRGAERTASVEVPRCRRRKPRPAKQRSLQTASTIGGFDKLSQRPAAGARSGQRVTAPGARGFDAGCGASRLCPAQPAMTPLVEPVETSATHPPPPRVPRASTRGIGPLTEPCAKSSDALVRSREQVKQRSLQTASTFGGFDKLSQRVPAPGVRGFDAGCGASRLCPAQPAVTPAIGSTNDARQRVPAPGARGFDAGCGAARLCPAQPAGHGSTSRARLNRRPFVEPVETRQGWIRAARPQPTRCRAGGR